MPINRRQRYSIAGILAVIVLSLPFAALAAAPTTFADNFSDHSYNINDGLSDWSTDWIEAGESDGALTGHIQIDGRIPCAVGKCLDLKDNGASAVSITRTADLSGYSTAVLTYTYQRHRHRGPNSGKVELQVKADGGTWSTMRSYSYAAGDTVPRIASVDISGFVSSATAIRFVIDGGGSTHHLMVDFVMIAASGSPSTTTTTTPPTTTTTSTATTVPPSATTTTVATEPTTTTTTSPTPSTTDTVIAAAPPVSQSTTTTSTIPLSVEEAAVVALNTPALDLSTRYVSVASGQTAGAVDGDPVSQTFLEIPAVGGLLAGFSTAVEGVAGSLMPSAILAVVVAWLSVQGLGSADRTRRRKKVG